MRRVIVWAPNYTAEAADFTYLWIEPDRRSVGIRLYNAWVKYNDGREEFLHVLDVHLRPDSQICWGFREVRGDEE
jgi:hypothetical protein